MRLLALVLRRLVWFVPTLLGLLAVTFVISRVIPADPVALVALAAVAPAIRRREDRVAGQRHQRATRAPGQRLADGDGLHQAQVAYRARMVTNGCAMITPMAAPARAAASAAAMASGLRDVSAAGPRSLWAVGWAVENEVFRPFVERWDGRRWTIMESALES